MRIIRYMNELHIPTLAVISNKDDVVPLPQSGLMELISQADADGTSPTQHIQSIIQNIQPLSIKCREDLSLLVPIEAPEVWAAGVTYERSRAARNFESSQGKLESLTVYDKVYDAERPEIFFKSNAARTIGPGQEVYLRGDSKWQIPEPELGLVINRRGRIVGYTIGNDMSCRDIEGENPLYLPQAKIWKHSCAIGPAVLLADTVVDPYQFEIVCRIYRNGEKVFEEHASTGQLKRKLDELVSFLIRDNEIFDGTVLLTGTCIVPPNDFTLADGDRIEIDISGIGTLINFVKSGEAG